MEDLPRHGDGAQQVVARLSADSSAAPGGEVELSLDTSQIKLFDADGGRSMTTAAA
jgi:multiple sugar transport system ATP-binding protein